MFLAEEFNDMKSAFADIEMNAADVKIRRIRLPDPRFRIQAPDFQPGRISDTFAVDFRIDKQKVKMVVLCFFIDLENDSAVFPDAASSSGTDTVLDPSAGNDLSVFQVFNFRSFFCGTVSEGALVVEDELFMVIVSKPGKYDVCHIG